MAQIGMCIVRDTWDGYDQLHCGEGVPRRFVQMAYPGVALPCETSISALILHDEWLSSGSRDTEFTSGSPEFPRSGLRQGSHGSEYEFWADDVSRHHLLLQTSHACQFENIR